MTATSDIPEVFALVRDADGATQIVGYGMVLPDGSTYSVSWPPERGTSFYSASNAEETAALRGAEVWWINDQPQRATPGKYGFGGPRG